MTGSAADLARALRAQAEAVCRAYLSNGRRAGQYWQVGDRTNAPGRSLYVRLRPGPDGRAAGKWTDAATGEHGDLLDIIASTRRLTTLRDILDEARSFLALPRAPIIRQPPVSMGSPESARRLWRMAQALDGTLAESYLCRRGLGAVAHGAALRFHPSCFYGGSEDEPRSAWPALLAAVTDDAGEITGLHRTWLDPATAGKAPVADPRRAMGSLLGHGVRFGDATHLLAAGEGLETMLSLRVMAPRLTVIAALSAAHLAALRLPAGLHRLYIAREADPAGQRASAELAGRAMAASITPHMLDACLSDFNEDLRRFGPDRLRAALRPQFERQDRALLFAA